MAPAATVTGIAQAPSARVSWISAHYAGATDSRAWSRIAYLVLAFPRGVAYFLLMLVGLSFGLAFAVSLIGLPILLVTLIAARALAGWERRLAGALLDTELRDPHRPITERRWLARLQAMLGDPATWKSVGYLHLAFPLGIVDFVAVAAMLGIPVQLAAAPLYFWALPNGIELGVLDADTLIEALLLSVVGLGLLPLGIRGAAAFAGVHATVARLLLTSPPDPELSARVIDLQSSRARIVAAADAERRRLERDLHDGAQQRLVALSLQLSMARERLSGEKEALELVTRAGEEAKVAIAELRDLARGIHPVVLSERGLGAALNDAAQRAPLPVEVSALDDRLPEALEVTAYFVVTEALTNVAKYAEATYATVSARVEGGSLVVEVTDDGRGGADASRGSGLRGLADRVGALEGEISIDSPPGGGTRLRASLPLTVIEGDVEVSLPDDVGRVLDAGSATVVRIRRRQVLSAHAAAFGVVEGVLVLIWAQTGAGYFWPVWPGLGWGTVLGLHAAIVAVRAPITEAALESEGGDEAVALRRLRRRRGLVTHAVVFGVVELMLLAIWALAGGGYLWPVWPFIGWGALLAVHGVVVRTRRPMTERAVARAMERSG